jgi:hypothetical protein
MGSIALLLIALASVARAQDGDVDETHPSETPATPVGPSDDVAPVAPTTEVSDTAPSPESEPTVSGAIEEGLEASAPAEAEVPEASAEAPFVPDGDRRDPAWFRGRPRDTTAEEVLLWIPRIVFYPVHLVAEMIRLPLLAFLTWAEGNHVFDVLPTIFHPIDELFWYPTLSLEAGIFVLPGLALRLQDLGVEGHGLRASGTFGGDDFWSASLRDEWQLGPVRIGAQGGYSTRPNRQYFGLGPGSPPQFVYYRERRGEARAFFVIEHEDHVEVEAQAGWAYEDIGPGYVPSFDVLPPELVSIAGPYQLFLAALEVRLDTREEVEENGGVHLHAGALYGVAPEGPTAHFLRFDVDLEGAVVVYPDRVLAARGHLIETVSLDGSQVPFQHLPVLGWDLHRGFVAGRFRGEAAAVAEVRYRYPIHYFVDMEWALSAGNVFDRQFSDFSFGALTGALSIGFRTRRTGFDPITFALAFGTTQFDRFDLEGVRFYVASSHGL